MNSLIWYSYHVHWMHTASSSQHSNISLEWKHIQSSKLCRTSNIDCIESTRKGFRNIKLRYISNNIAILGTKEKTFVVTNKTEKWKTQVVDHYTYTQVSWGRNDEKLDVFHSSLFYNRSQTRVGRRGNFRSRFHSLPLSPLLVVYLPLWKFSKTVFPKPSCCFWHEQLLEIAIFIDNVWVHEIRGNIRQYQVRVEADSVGLATQYTTRRKQLFTLASPYTHNFPPHFQWDVPKIHSLFLFLSVRQNVLRVNIYVLLQAPQLALCCSCTWYLWIAWRKMLESQSTPHRLYVARPLVRPRHWIAFILSHFLMVNNKWELISAKISTHFSLLWALRVFTPRWRAERYSPLQVLARIL